MRPTKTFAIATTIITVLFAVLLAAPRSHATSLATLKGTYSFQVSGFKNEFGYFSGSSFVQVTSCPTNQHCQWLAVPTLTYGALSFDGAGHAKFLSVTALNQGTGGPTTGSVWTYSVSGWAGMIGSSTNGASLALGNLNASGVATTVLIRTGGQSPETGIATLQGSA